MRAFVLIAGLLLATPAVAQAADPSIWSRDVSLGLLRGPASVQSGRPFDLVGVHWRGSGRVELRTRGPSGWGAWRPAAPEAEDRPDRGAPERTLGAWHTGNPWWARGAERLEVRTRGHVTRVRAWFVRSPSASVPLRRAAVAGSPKIVPRRAWGANEKIVRAAPRYAPVLRFAIVHHTAGSSAYGPEESAAIVRGIELYHVQANGWNDIGYNFLVDRYGQVFEGRGGGMQRNVIGAHAEGFNTGSVGIALIGTYSAKTPAREAEDALGSLLAWRLDVGHVDPASSAMITSGGNAKLRPGAGAYLRAISGHRDAGFTACPGDSLYARLGSLREVALTTGLPKLYQPRLAGKLGKFVRFTARLSAPLLWTVTVKGPDGAPLAQRTGTSDRISWFWDSTGLAPARYMWTMEATGARPARGTVTGSTEPEPVKVSRPPATALLASPRVVSPDGDGYADLLTVRYTLNERSIVNAWVEDESGLRVVSLAIDARQQRGARSLAFAPDALPDGRYRLVVTARGDSGRKARLVDELVVMRTLAWLRVDPPTLSPNGDGAGDSITISFVLRGAGLVSVEIRDGTYPLALLQSAWLEPGSHGALWNGQLPQGTIAPGSYDVWVTVSTELGTITQKAPLIVAP
ncbi:MAG TPA: peptidoglycan recognition protein [Gaiellaceae bacterium]|nr:peptidoglycan recognition protein [Gaiellaceae bacterium]